MTDNAAKRKIVYAVTAAIIAVALLLSCVLTAFFYTRTGGAGTGNTADGGENADENKLLNSQYSYGERLPGDVAPSGSFVMTIASATDLTNFLNSTTYTYGILTQDISLSSSNMSNTSGEVKPSTDRTLAEGKTLDGNGHTIGGSWVKDVRDGGNSYASLFWEVGGTVRNLNMSGDITVSGQATKRSYVYVAGISIGASGGGTITGCTYSGTLTVNVKLTEDSDLCIGGIVGTVSVGTISGCTFNGTINATGSTAGNKYIDGIAGRSPEGTLADDNKDTGTIIQ